MTFLCNIPEVHHFAWCVPGYLENQRGLIGGRFPIEIVDQFTLTAAIGSSTLQVIAFRGLNNINISCAESAFNTSNIFVQHVEILGMNKFFIKRMYLSEDSNV